MHPNTIQVILNIFKTIVNRAIEIDNKIKPEENPFLKFKYSGVKTIKDKLNETELDAILALDLKENSLIWHCRNYFFFSFYCAGIRIGDLIQLRWCNITSEGRLHYQMGKNHKDRDLKLVPEALNILKYYYRENSKPTEYIFPLLEMKSTWAKYISQEEKISFHISRHSFAKIAKEKGLDNLEVKALLAHTNISTTQKYMGDFDTQRDDEALNKVFKKEDDTDKLLQQLKNVNPEILKAVLEKLTK